jgi:hypothetical protein
MKTRVQQVFEQITNEQAVLVAELVSGTVEDAAEYEETPSTRTLALQALSDTLDAAMASYAEEE